MQGDREAKAVAVSYSPVGVLPMPVKSLTYLGIISRCMKSRRRSSRICVADKEQNSLAQRSRRTQRFPTQTPSMQCPKRKRVADVELGIQVINEIQPAILQRTAVGFDLAKSKRVERAAVLVGDSHNYLVLTRSFFHRDYLCRNRAHQSLMFSTSS
jgi:hypothetical protein